MEYSTTIWNTGYLGDIRLLESLQRRWTREIRGVSSLEYSERLKILGLYSVYGRLLRNDFVKVWKAFNGRLDVGLKGLFCRSDESRTRGHAYKLRAPIALSEMRRRWFSVRVVKRWNELPSTVVEASSVESFKVRLDGFLRDELFKSI